MKQARSPSATKPRSPRKGAPANDTPPSPVPLPPLHGEPVLPLVSVGSVKFEQLCRDILRLRFGHIESVALKRTSGAPQFGIDVEGHDSDHEPEVVVQAKCYREIKAKYFRPWVEEFTKHLGTHWNGRRIRHFVLAVSHEANDDDINEEWRGLVADLKAYGIQGHLWNAYDITDLLRKDAGLVARYFHEVWVGAISAVGREKLPAVQNAAGESSGLHSSPIHAATIANAQALSTLVPLLGASASARLEAALDNLRAGRQQPLAAFLAETIEDPSAWDALAPELQARLLRAKALTLLRVNDTAGARSLITRANALAPAPDEVACAALAAAEGTIQDGLKILTSPTAVREREVKAGWLLEVGAAADALSVLEPVTGTDVTAEVLRLRAIALFRKGKREPALRMAQSACAKAPYDVMPRLTLGSMRVMSALAEGSEAQFGAAPNPVNPGLVREDRDARELLSEAVRDFEQLIASVENSLKADIEVWRLAALLLHPERRADARAAGRQLLSRPKPEPIVVAWGIQFSLRMQKGKISKLFADLIRSGEGTPSHLAVLALLTAKKQGARAGLHVLNQHAQHFPQARDFIDMWRANFGDPEAEGPMLPRLIHQAIREKNNTPLVAFFMTGNASADDLIAGATFLAQQQAWNDLDELRPHLSRIETEAAVGLAATAALESGKPQDAIDIIGASAEAFEEGRLPRNLIHTRIRASERLGWHRPVIEDLTTLLSENDDADLRRRLTIAFLRIGDLKQAKAEFERMLDGRNPDRRDLLAFADALRAYAPETARRAVSRLSSGEDSLSPEMASALLGLAGELGLTEIQSRMIPLLVADANRPGSTVKALSVEEMLEFIQERAAEARARVEAWLKGESPAAVAMATDKAGFARLFLASPAQRRTQEGTEIPMLLRSAAWDFPPALDLAGRPDLRLDLSALLLAHRIDLLHALDEGFWIQVPDSLPGALIELERTFPDLDGAWVAACRDALNGNRVPASGALNASGRHDAENLPDALAGRLRVVASATSNVLALHDEKEPNEMRPGLLRALARHAFEEGHWSGDWVDAATSVDAETDAQLIEYPDRLLLNTDMLFRLVGLGLLAPLTRAYDIEITRIEADRASSQLDRIESDARIRESLTTLREAVAERLRDGVWVSIPTPPDQNGEGVEARLPLHVRCLIETLRDTPTGSLAWIEDRIVSRGLGGSMPDIVAVLEALKTRGIIDEAKVQRSLRLLRELGYSSLPIDRSAILADIRAAPTDADQLIETAELAAWRSWFALDVDRLKYIDTTLARDEVGALAGEVRRALALGDLTRSLLADIWRDETADTKVKTKRSNWVWRALRVETFPFASHDPDAIRQHAGLMLGHILDLPFMAEIDDKLLPLEGRQGFVSWFVNDVLDPASRADERLAELVAMFLADLFARCLSLDFLADVPAAERPLIQDEFRRRVSRFLDLLPDPWTDRIVAEHDLAAQVGRVTQIVLTLEGATIVPVVEIARAYAEGCEHAKRGERTTVPMVTAQGEHVSLDVAPGNNAEPSAGIIVGDRRLPVDAMTLALAHPHPEVRAVGLSRIPNLVDTTGSVRREDWEEVARTLDVEERFAQARILMEGDFNRQLVRLRADFEAGRAISLDDFALPAPAVVAKYLGLATAKAITPEAVAMACPALVERIGPAAAAARLAGWPGELPSDALGHLGSDPAALDDDGQVWVRTPLRILMRLRLLGAGEGTSEAALTLCRQLSDGLAGEVPDLFVSLVRQAARQAGVTPEWVGLPPEARTSLLWVWASAVCDVFASAAAPARLADFLAQLTPRELRNLLADERLPAWERHIGPGLSAPRFRAIAVSRCLEMSTPDAEISGRLQSVLGPEGRADWEPSQHLLLPPPPAPQDIWVARDPVGAMARAGWLADDTWFAVRDIETLVRLMLDRMGDEAEPFVLPASLFHVDVERVSPDGLRLMRETIERLDGERYAEPQWNAAIMIMNASAGVWGRLDDVNGFRVRLERQAERCASRWPRARPRASQPMQRSVALSLAEAAFRHGRALPRPLGDQMQAFAGSVEAAATAWPAFNPVFMDALDTVCRQSSTDVASVVWPSLMRLRAKVA